MAAIMSKEELLQKFAAAYENLISTATTQRDGGTHQTDAWGPREIVAHLAGWEIMATVRIPKIVAGMPPTEFGDAAQTKVMNDAINKALVTLSGDQPLDTLCDELRQAYQHNVALLGTLDETLFQPGTYVYERTKDVIEHCQEHMEQITANEP